MFDWSIKFGDILTMGGALFVGLTILLKRNAHTIQSDLILRTVTQELAELKLEVKTFGVTISKIAVQEEKINLLMKWYDELRRGVGRIEE